MAASSEIQDFFRAFERNSSTLDLDRIGAQFADTFLSADPKQVVSVPKAAFLATLPRRQALFDAAGITAMELVAVDERALDERHRLAATEWDARRKDGGSVRLASTFILRREGSSFVIIFYLNHQDLTEVLGPGG
jgi:hypothetical protein